MWDASELLSGRETQDSEQNNSHWQQGKLQQILDLDLVLCYWKHICSSF